MKGERGEEEEERGEGEEMGERGRREITNKDTRVLECTTRMYLYLHVHIIYL